MVMLFYMRAILWSCYISWSPYHDLAMILPWGVWITMIIKCHSMTVMFDHGCQTGFRQKIVASLKSSLLLLYLLVSLRCMFRREIWNELLFIKLYIQLKVRWPILNDSKILAGKVLKNSRTQSSERMLWYFVENTCLWTSSKAVFVSSWSAQNWPVCSWLSKISLVESACFDQNLK